jgi:hypothetical protein
MERATPDPDLKRLNATLYDFALVHNQENPDMSSAHYRRYGRSIALRRSASLVSGTLSASDRLPARTSL